MSTILETILGDLTEDGNASIMSTLKFKHYKCTMIERINHDNYILRFWNNSNYRVPEEESLTLNKADLISFVDKYKKF